MGELVLASSLVISSWCFATLAASSAVRQNERIVQRSESRQMNTSYTAIQFFSIQSGRMAAVPRFS